MRSRLLQHPAIWPLLALDPEPSADPESAERLYSEMFGFDSERRRVEVLHAQQ